MNSDSNDLKPSQLCQRINRVCQNSEPLAGGAHIHFVQNDLFGAVRSRAGRRSSPNTKYKIPR